MKFALLVRLACLLLVGALVLQPAEALARPRKQKTSSRSTAKKSKSLSKGKKAKQRFSKGKKSRGSRKKAKFGRTSSYSRPARAQQRSNELPMTIAEREKAMRR